MWAMNKSKIEQSLLFVLGGPIEKRSLFFRISPKLGGGPSAQVFGHLNILLMGAKINVHLHNYELLGATFTSQTCYC